MKIESISSPPPEPSPQMRYASLHRAAEKGMASDATWIELTRICVQLGLHDEALSSFAKVEDPNERRLLQGLLLKHAVVVLPDPAEQPTTVSRPKTGWRNELVDGLHFLMDDSMPSTLVALTVTFPVVVGLCGTLLSASIPGLKLLFLVPAAMVLFVLAGLLRRVLVEAANGLEDAPRLTPIGRLCRESLRLTREVGPVVLVCLGPALVLEALRLPAAAVLGAMVLAAVIIPMATLLRVFGPRSASPQAVVVAIARGGIDYFGFAMVGLALCAPAALGWILANGVPVHLRLAVAGPLAVAPLVLATRLLGRFAMTHRAVLDLQPITQPAGERRALLPTAGATRAAGVTPLLATTATPSITRQRASTAGATRHRSH